MDNTELQRIIEALLLASEQPLTVDRILALFDEAQRPDKAELKQAIEDLRASLEGRAVELREVGNGWRLQTRTEYAVWISKLWEEKPPRYSRALLETLALICYRQPISRAEIEDVRGVGLSQSILKTLLERNWVRIVGYREVPGRPALFGTTREFLDDFNIRNLDELPTLPEMRDLDALTAALEKLHGAPAAPPDAGVGEGEEASVPGSETLH